jgi:hypothetical protein
LLLVLVASLFVWGFSKRNPDGSPLADAESAG